MTSSMVDQVAVTIQHDQWTQSSQQLLQSIILDHARALHLLHIPSVLLKPYLKSQSNEPVSLSSHANQAAHAVFLPRGSSSWDAAFCSGSSRLLCPFQWTNKEVLYNHAGRWPFMCFHHDSHRAGAISPLCYGSHSSFGCSFIQMFHSSNTCCPLGRVTYTFEFEVQFWQSGAPTTMCDEGMTRSMCTTM